MSAAIHGMLAWALTATMPVAPTTATPAPMWLEDVDIYEPPPPPAAALPEKKAPQVAKPTEPPQPETASDDSITPRKTDPKPRKRTRKRPRKIARTTQENNRSPKVNPVANDAGVTDHARGDAGPYTADDIAQANAADPAQVDRAIAAMDVDLLAHAPSGDVIAVLLRFDRLRGTPWAQKAEAVLAPMPDYRSLVGSRNVALASMLDMLFITSSAPRYVTATTIVAQSRLSAADTGAFIDHDEAAVHWTGGPYGTIGRRRPSPLVPPRDPRVFVLPTTANAGASDTSVEVESAINWLILAHPRHLGALAQTTAAQTETQTASKKDAPSPLASAQAIIAAGPPWLEQLARADAVATLPQEPGPALSATIQGLLPSVYQAPYIGVITPPQRITLAVELVESGFLVRGVMTFRNDDQADSFVAAIRVAQTNLVTGGIGRMLLQRAHAFHAVSGLSLRQRRAKVAYATSISIADAGALLDLIAARIATYFSTRMKSLQ